MNVLVRAAALLLLFLLSSCGPGGVSTGVPPTPNELVLTFSTSPIELPGINARFAANVAYDDQQDTVFDIFLPAADQPTGLVIYVHGGGFTGGDKSAAYTDALADHVREALSQGVAYATINYQLLDAVDNEGVIKPLSDSRRALQFIRHHAGTFNINSARIAMYGTSAGAGTSLWLAFHDEMANFQSADPVLRQSTRISAVGAIETQASYDLYRWESDVFVDFGITVESLLSPPNNLSRLVLSFYGLSSVAQLQSAAVDTYRADVDLLRLMSVDDPAMWLSNTQQSVSVPGDIAALYHHPFHARELKEQADLIGISNVSYIPEIGINDPSGEGVMSFLLRQVR